MKHITKITEKEGNVIFTVERQIDSYLCIGSIEEVSINKGLLFNLFNSLNVGTLNFKEE